jgi:hypothetical protein
MCFRLKVPGVKSFRYFAKASATILTLSLCALSQLPDAPSESKRLTLPPPGNSQQVPIVGPMEKHQVPPDAIYDSKTQQWEAIDRRPLFTKPFIAAHLAMLAADVYDMEMTHQGLAHHKCVEKNVAFASDRHPSRGALYGHDLVVDAAFFGFDLAMQKAHVRFVPYMLPMLHTGNHIRNGTEWAVSCW